MLSTEFSCSGFNVACAALLCDLRVPPERAEQGLKQHGKEELNNLTCPGQGTDKAAAALGVRVRHKLRSPRRERPSLVNDGTWSKCQRGTDGARAWREQAVGKRGCVGGRREPHASKVPSGC